MDISIEELKKILSYDKEAGILTWRKNFNGHVKDERAGRNVLRSNCAYTIVTISSRMYYAGRICYSLATNENISDGYVVKFKDRDATNLRWDNLELKGKSDHSNLINTISEIIDDFTHEEIVSMLKKDHGLNARQALNLIRKVTSEKDEESTIRTYGNRTHYFKGVLTYDIKKVEEDRKKLIENIKKYRDVSPIWKFMYG